jgi:hypothetical protein
LSIILPYTFWSSKNSLFSGFHTKLQCVAAEKLYRFPRNLTNFATK